MSKPQPKPEPTGNTNGGYGQSAKEFEDHLWQTAFGGRPERPTTAPPDTNTQSGNSR